MPAGWQFQVGMPQIHNGRKTTLEDVVKASASEYPEPEIAKGASGASKRLRVGLAAVHLPFREASAFRSQACRLTIKIRTARRLHLTTRPDFDQSNHLLRSRPRAAADMRPSLIDFSFDAHLESSCLPVPLMAPSVQ